MDNFTEFSVEQLNKLRENPFSLFANDWALVTAGNDTDFNTMTVSWGGLGVLWNKNVATIYIRPQRYTRKFIEENDYFTISVLPNSYKKALTICGRVSGRDTNKIEQAQITPAQCECSMSFDEARLVFYCKKLYHSDITPTNFYDPDIDKNYPDNDYHRMYIGEIVKVFVREI